MRPYKELRYLRRSLLRWFDENRRRFPWREDKATPYEIIMSEVLLQRTKAETVARYYPVFFRKYPDWEALSQASLPDLEDILKPLGLYRHRAKRIIAMMEDYKARMGVLPKDTADLQESSMAPLYIAGAYTLFVLKRRAALLDVNMARVLGRFFLTPVKSDVRHDRDMQALATALVNVKRCKELNWAVLDLSALHCRPAKPNCTRCPLHMRCRYCQTTADAPDLKTYANAESD